MGIAKSPALLLAATLTQACAPTYAPPTVSVRVHGTPPDAVVIVDDQRVGKLATVIKRGLAVRPGRHRITVEHAGYFPWDRAFDADGSPVQLDVALERVPE